MLTELREALAEIPCREGRPPPAVDYKLYFEGNEEEECIAPNQWGEGRPSIAVMYARFQEIASRTDVEGILVGLHADWNDESYSDGYPPAENVHIFTTASKADVQRWVEGLHCDGVVKGWPNGKPPNAPEPSKGHAVFSVCWD